MKKLSVLLTIITLLFSLLTISCEKDKPIDPKSQALLVSQFVYDGMSNFYLWADEVTNKKPKATDVDPEKYFYSILNATDTKHGWSWITDDVDDLLKGFQGESTDAFGFQPLPLYTDEARTTIVGFIRYVYPETPAAEAGLKRGEVIIKKNGKTLKNNNKMGLFGETQKRRLPY